MRVVLAAIFLLSAIFVYDALGRPEGAFSVNIHLVPAIVRGNCTAGQTWKPPNVKCAQCLCIANRFSRCVPEFGCKPLGTNGTTTTTAPGSPTTPTPTGSTQVTTATQASNLQDATQATEVPNPDGSGRQ
ncbi:unnamed protein product [Allacma fusca]|uniref:Uncharacterized protein n=1 Tax=Allacma fusca TaxID=39272 RepID=A0A8J2P8X9_9HEXA|nr:unnamed protein product [Allacma fusca]